MGFQPSTIHTYADLVTRLSSLPLRQSTLLVGVDGCGGSGKSTFACLLHEHMPNSTIIHMDDLYLPRAQRPTSEPTVTSIVLSYNIARLREDVLFPLSQDRDGLYQRYDWPSDQLAESHTVPCGGTVIVEGVSSLTRQLIDFYDFTVWVECPYEIRLARGLERDGEALRHFWVDEWMPAEQVYLRVEHPDQRAKLRLDGSGQQSSADLNALFPLPSASSTMD